MSIARFFQACGRWHFRVLGTFWTLCGLFCLGDLIWRSYWWDQKTPWIPIVVGIPFIVVGVGFVRGRVWARGGMLPLMLFAGLVSFDGFLCGGFNNNLELVWLSVAGLAVVAYTGVFALFSVCKACREYV